MRKSKLAVAVLVSAGLLFGASGTALAAGGGTKPETTPAVAEPSTAPADEVRPTPAETTARPTKRPSEPSPTATVPDGDVPVARPARPVQGNPSFTG